MKTKAGLAFSGGLDSTAAGLILASTGYEVFAITMSTGNGQSGETVDRASRIARRLGFQHHIIDLGGKFEKKVIAPFVNAYLNGTTPNPCIDCNREIKFKDLFNAAFEAGCSLFATGHYARTTNGPAGTIQLKRGTDIQKDQSYMLWTLNRETLSKVLFPVGTLTKDKVRKLVRENGIEETAPESQDICFLAGKSYGTFFENRDEINVEPGPIRTREGDVIGKHKGLPFYTIGQRKGLNLGTHEMMFVIEINPMENAITVGGKDDLKRTEFNLLDVNFIDGEPPSSCFECDVETRYRGPLIHAEVEMKGSSESTVHYDEPGLWGAPGQSAVFYRGEHLLGGGVIDSIR